ncbi:helix-turn-helix transcriptional regulator [uncultured Parasphingorhabdus sp.]|uniref:helix-turn-helix domain-containing protein n=1 Tax=uncultured Parasphingorhabdus sp. TaxID=2709694 RepID=UPI0030D9D529|tara:strand:- start:95803 stop:96966 length:1164 start_codon:yes stop_codon:yes gene_type:complete
MTIFYAAAAAVIVFSLAMTFGQREDRKDQSISFAALLLALLAHVLGELLIISGAYEIAPHLVGVELSVRMALGPAVLFYTRALVSPTQFSFGGRDWFALLGPALVILISLPFSFLSAEEKLALVDPATRNPVHFQIALFTCTAGILLFLAFTTFYLIGALKLQAKHRSDMMQQFASIDRRSLNWLRNVLLMFCGVWLFLGIKQVLWVSGISVPRFYVTLALVEMLSIAVFAYLGVRQPPLNFDENLPSPSPRMPFLTDAHMVRIAAKITAALNTDRLYADSDLSLRDLSDVTGATKNHISETLSQHLEVNFFDFVNRCRVDEAKRLLVETDETVLAIGYEVGFNSRSTFNEAFKKHGGSTPSAYRAAEREELLPVLNSAKKISPTVS